MTFGANPGVPADDVMKSSRTTETRYGSAPRRSEVRSEIECSLELDGIEDIRKYVHGWDLPSLNAVTASAPLVFIARPPVAKLPDSLQIVPLCRSHVAANVAMYLDGTGSFVASSTRPGRLQYRFRRGTFMRNAIVSALAITAVALVLNGPSWAANPLSDVEIAHAAYTADDLDIAYAKIALEKSQTPTIREFAQLMVKDHTAANEAALALVKKLSVTPKDNPFSQTLVKNGEAKKAELRGLSGTAFDRAYAQNELAYHQIVVKTVAEQWIPTIQNVEFRKFMTDANEIFKAHLNHAQHVVDGLK